VRAIKVIAIIAAIAAGSAAILYFYPLFLTGEAAGDQKQVSQTNQTNNGYRQVGVTVNGFEMVADVAATNDQRSKGLAIKDHLNENESMLFVFSTARDQAFWMKDMKFPIDIIWMDANKTVVHVEHSLEPCPVIGFCKTYSPGTNSLYVLETVAGFADKHRVHKGTKIEFNLE